MRAAPVQLWLATTLWGLIRANQPLDDCAVPLPAGPAAFDTTTEFSPNASFGIPSDSLSCIRYSDVEIAFDEATLFLKTDLPPSGEEWRPKDVKEAGELLLDTSGILAEQFGLSPLQVHEILPQIDISNTQVKGVCPPFASPLRCIAGRYRRNDGLCNNLRRPTWGATRSVFTRLLPPVYEDGVSEPRKSSFGGEPLPLVRTVSTSLHKNKAALDNEATLMFVAWGQFMDHDFVQTATPSDPVTLNEPEDCCNRPSDEKNPYCFEIEIPPQDDFYKPFGVNCLNFVRGFAGVRQDCRLGNLEQFNILTSVIDGNTVYGGSDSVALNLRNMTGGQMKKSHLHRDKGSKDLLPPKMTSPSEGCIRDKASQHCFLAGEKRANEQVTLTCIHTIAMREHNRIANILQDLNPHWSDEVLYQEARHIVAAEIQHVTYNEFLPMLLGKNVTEDFGLDLSEGYWDGYDPNTDPSMIAAFVAAAFRFGHSLLPSAVERWSPDHKFVATRSLRSLLRQPYDLYNSGEIDQYLLGMANQPTQAMDDAITQEVSNHLFEKPGDAHGMDLISFNLQRGREFGIPGYNAYRKFCGLPPANSFADLAPIMTNSTAVKYSKIYKHVDDIDLWSGGVSERPQLGSMLGPTFTCIIGHQMQRVRKGDRFWYELPNQPSSFTPEQLSALKKVRMARLICDNSDTIKTIQQYPFVLHDNDKNRRVSCKSGMIPTLDLTPWKDLGLSSSPSSFTPTLIEPPDDDGYEFPPNVAT